MNTPQDVGESSIEDVENQEQDGKSLKESRYAVQTKNDYLSEKTVNPENCYGGYCKWKTLTFILGPIIVALLAVSITLLILFMIQKSGNYNESKSVSYYYKNICDSYCASREGNCNWVKDSDKPLDADEINEKIFASKTDDDYIRKYCCINMKGSKTGVCGGNKDLNKSIVNYLELPNTLDARDLVFRIGDFMENYNIKVWWKWTTNYDRDHLLPYAHIMPNLKIWSNYENYLGKYGLPSGIQTIKDRNNEDEDYFAVHKNEIMMGTCFAYWDKSKIKPLKNFIELTHGADEDGIYANDAHNIDSYASYEGYNPVFLSKYAKEKNPQSKEYNFKKVTEKFKEKGDGEKQIVIYIATKYMGPLDYHMVLCKDAYTNNGKNRPPIVLDSLQQVSENYNLIISIHPYESEEDIKDYTKNLPKALIIKGPELNIPDILAHKGQFSVAAVIGESSGGTFKELDHIIKQKIPFIHANQWKGSDKWEKLSKRVLNETMCTVHGSEENFFDSITKAIKLKNENPAEFNNQMEKLRAHLIKLQGEPHEFSEYENFISILKGLDCDKCLTKEYTDDINDLEQRYNKMVENNKD